MNFIAEAPNSSGVYLMKDRTGGIIYVGRATSLKDRMHSYFGPGEKTPRPIENAISEVASIEFVKTPSLLEAIILEANLIKKFEPIYNVKDKDDRSFLYIVITKEEFPKIRLMRKQEIDQVFKGRYPASNIFGPYPSATLARTALDIMRKIFHYSNCEPKSRPCFYYRIRICPGICTGEITSKEYKREIIKPLILFLQGKRIGAIKDIERRMKQEAKEQNFEQAAIMRNQLFALKHINDVALLQSDETLAKKESGNIIDVFGRIEGYDISNISGTNSVGSMVVFQNGKSAKGEYRKFKIKYVKGINDVAMIKEVVGRRLHNNWPKPDILLIDGGRGQVNAAEEALRENKKHISVLGLAKGFARKNDHFVYGFDLTPRERQELERITESNMRLFKQIRDEAHRFAITFHRQRRSNVLH